MKKFFILLFFLMALSSYGNSLPAKIISSYQVQGLNQHQMDQVALKFEVVKKLGVNSYEVYVLKNKRNEFLKFAPNAKLIKENIYDDFSKKDLSSYPTNEEVYNQVKSYEAQFPHILKVIPYGHSQQGRLLFSVKISDHVLTDEKEKRSLLLTATHGDELITVRVALERIKELIHGYGQDKRITKLVDNNEIYFVPVTNPDGYSSWSRYANGRDPNRSYPWPGDPNQTPSKCIADLINFYRSKNFQGVLDIHAYGKMVMYPWAYTRKSLEEHDRKGYEHLGQKMVKNNHYHVGQISRIIYLAPGSSADYFHSTGSISYGIEVARSKAPSSLEIPAILENTREMLWTFIEEI